MSKTIDGAVAEWTARKKDSKDVRDDFAAQNAYLFNLLVAAVSETVRAKVAAEVADNAEGSEVNFASNWNFFMQKEHFFFHLHHTSCCAARRASHPHLSATRLRHLTIPPPYRSSTPPSSR